VAAHALRDGERVELTIISAAGDFALRSVALVRPDGTVCERDANAGWASSSERGMRLPLAGCADATHVAYVIRRRGREERTRIPIER
jgi:hypothetical protein